MFDDFRNLAKKFIKLDENKLLSETLQLQKIKQFIISLNLYDQLFDKGINSKNQTLGFYSPLTEILSNGRKRAGDHYTLHDTGEFYKSVKLNFGSTYFEIDENYSKFDIIKKYGNDILGLTDENLTKLIEQITPTLNQKILEKI